MTENPIKIGGDLVRSENGQFVAGHPDLGAGRPLGSTDFNTDFDEVIEDIAKEQGITKSEARKALLKVAYNASKEKNFSFWSYIHDRKYGKITDKVAVKVDSDTLATKQEVEELNERFNNFLKEKHS